MNPKQELTLGRLLQEKLGNNSRKLWKIVCEYIGQEKINNPDLENKLKLDNLYYEAANPSAGPQHIIEHGHVTQLSQYIKCEEVKDAIDFICKNNPILIMPGTDGKQAAYFDCKASDNTHICAVFDRTGRLITIYPTKIIKSNDEGMSFLDHRTINLLP